MVCISVPASNDKNDRVSHHRMILPGPALDNITEAGDINDVEITPPAPRIQDTCGSRDQKQSSVVINHHNANIHTQDKEIISNITADDGNSTVEYRQMFVGNSNISIDGITPNDEDTVDQSNYIHTNIINIDGIFPDVNDTVDYDKYRKMFEDKLSVKDDYDWISDEESYYSDDSFVTLCTDSEDTDDTLQYSDTTSDSAIGTESFCINPFFT